MDRRAAIGAPQGLDDDDYTFLRQAYENDLLLVFTQKNPKRLTSRKRYEKYKSTTNLRAAVNFGATWDDIINGTSTEDGSISIPRQEVATPPSASFWNGNRSAP